MDNLNTYQSNTLRRVHTGRVNTEAESVHYWVWRADGYPSWEFTILA